MLESQHTNLRLEAENGMFLRFTSEEWMTTMPELLNMDWVENVQLVHMLRFEKHH